MARAFDGTAKYFRRINIPDGGGGLNQIYTMSCWFRPNDLTSRQTIVSLGQKDIGAIDERVYMALQVGGDISTAVHVVDDPLLINTSKTPGSSLGTNVAATTASIVGGSWNHACCYHNDNLSTGDGNVFINGAAEAGDRLMSTGPHEQLLIGAWEDGNTAPTNFFDGDIADVFLWNTELTQNEISLLAEGVPAWLIRQTNIISWVPLIHPSGDEPDWTDRYSAVETGTIGSARGPGRMWPMPVGAAGGWRGPASGVGPGGAAHIWTAIL